MANTNGVEKITTNFIQQKLFKTFHILDLGNAFIINI